MAKSESAQILIFGGIGLLAVYLLSKKTANPAVSSPGVAAPGMGGPAGSPGGAIALGINQAIKGFTSGANTNLGGNQGPNAIGYAGLDTGGYASAQQIALGAASEGPTLGPSKSGAVPLPPDLGLPALPGVTSTNDPSSPFAILSGGGGGGLNSPSPPITAADFLVMAQ